MEATAPPRVDEAGTAVAPLEDVPSLIRLAIEEKVPVEVLERIVALQERVTDRLARTEFFAALKAFQDDCPELHKSKSADIVTKSGGRYGYTYAPLDGIARTVRPILNMHGLSYSWTTEPSPNADLVQVVCVLRHVDGHEERAIFPVPHKTSAAMSEAQKYGAALTYGQRMSLVSVLGITASDDVDGADAEQGVISADQVKELNDLIDASKADFKKFLSFMGVDMMGDIRRNDFAKAVSALARKAVTTA